jgi:hypothetical protein
MRSFADPSPGILAARKRAYELNRRQFEVKQLADERRVAEFDRRMRIAAESKLNEIAQVNRAKFAEVATEQAMRKLGQEIGKRFADRLERMGASVPGQMDARMVYHMAEQVFRDNLDAGRICNDLDKSLSKELNGFESLKLRVLSALKTTIERVARERLGLWSMPSDIQQWFYEVMDQAEPHVVPHVSYRSVANDFLVAEPMIKVEVVWPRDVLAYNVALGH